MWLEWRGRESSVFFVACRIKFPDQGLNPHPAPIVAEKLRPATMGAGWGASVGE